MSPAEKVAMMRLEQARKEAIRTSIETLVKRGELPLWQTDDDRGLTIDEYFEFYESVSNMLREP